MSRALLPDHILRHAAERPQAPAIWSRDDGGNWQSIDWASYVGQVRGFAGALLGMDYAPGQTVAIMSNNVTEWVLAAVGSMFARAVYTGVYQTLNPTQAAYVIGHCEARVVVIEDFTQWEKIAAERASLPALERVVMIHDAERVDDPIACSFEAFVAEGAAHQSEVDARLEALEPGDLATLIYTSGTTGNPKGVMLDHRALAFVGAGSMQLIPGVSDTDASVSYLPLSHIAEQVFSILGPGTIGYAIWMCPSIPELKEVLVAARPTLFLAVPRVWEKFKAALEGKLADASGIKGMIVNWARGVGAEAGKHLVDKGEPGGLLGFKYRLADKLFFSKLKAQLGLDRLKLAVTGAAPIGNDVLDFFLSCGIVIHEVYGQSEDAGPTTFNQPYPGKRRLGTVGLPFPGVEVKIAEDGEILVRGPNVFQGYYKNPEATAETLVDGWLHSGDIGTFDDGFLRITDRKKDLIITAGGKNVAPQKIEKALRRIPGIGQAVVIGDRRKFLSALLTIDAEAGPAFAKSKGWPAEVHDLAEHPEFRAHVEAGVEAANGELSRYQTIKRFAVLAEDFTVEGGELTPTQKVKRRIVNEKYATEIEGLYADVS
jgi:long-chain acyl-CoA synthetase